jgi:hypothetical protein
MFLQGQKRGGNGLIFCCKYVKPLVRDGGNRRALVPRRPFEPLLAKVDQTLEGTQLSPQLWELGGLILVFCLFLLDGQPIADSSMYIFGYG